MKAQENGVTEVTGLHEATTDRNYSKTATRPPGYRHGDKGYNSRPAPGWQSLAASSLSDMDVDDLDSALFLFALRMIQTTPPPDLARTWKQYGPFWAKRLRAGAFRIVAKEYRMRSGETGTEQG